MILTWSRKNLALLAFALGLAPLHASAAPLRTQKVLKTTVEKTLFRATLEKGYHFNEKAPNGVQIDQKFLKPQSFSSRQLEVAGLPENLSGATANLYVCDDQVTFCEVHTLALGELVGTKKGTKSSATSKLMASNKYGFFTNFESGLKLAKNLKQNVFVEFGARWCPACLRLESEVFNSVDFRELTQNYVKVKVDVDEFQNVPLLEKYDVRVYPTLVTLNPQGEEIIRLHDYQPIATLTKIFDEVRKHPESIASLEKRPLTAELEKILWPRYFHGGKYDKAQAILEKVDPRPSEYWTARVEAARTRKKQDPKLKEDFIKTLKAALKAEPDSSRSLYWRVLMALELPEGGREAREVANESQKLSARLLKNPEELKQALLTDSLGEYTGLESFFVAQLAAEASEIAQLNSKEAWSTVVEQGEKAKISAEQPGPALRLLSAMMKAEKYDQAHKLVKQLLSKDPQNGDLQRRELRVLLYLGKYDEAVNVGERALKNSYGINEFFVVEPLAKAYISLKKKDLAKSLVQKYLSKNEINFPDMENLKKSLEGLYSKLQ
ncbi:MAG: tetratricopeptide repeat protein [Bdellovibrionales bacterium]